ncbi:hypothetical protein ACQP2U_42605 (plasmid) [Nocardia sp. CA-084685]|uniref:hypothetical protein n=1 Tax=Nocardia sp. CA-084685 TaxID=3239970 RepID=UPI003D953642
MTIVPELRPALPDWTDLLSALWENTTAPSGHDHPIVRAGRRLAQLHRDRETSCDTVQFNSRRAELVSDINGRVPVEVHSARTVGATIDKIAETVVFVQNRLRIEPEAAPTVQQWLAQMSDAWTELVSVVENSYPVRAAYTIAPLALAYAAAS